jgi:hypothetical protein
VAINDLTDTKTNAHLLKWDSTYGRYPGEVAADKDGIIADGKRVKVFAEKDPGNIAWRETGQPVFPTGELAQGYSWTQSTKVILPDGPIEASTTYESRRQNEATTALPMAATWQFFGAVEDKGTCSSAGRPILQRPLILPKEARS